MQPCYTIGVMKHPQALDNRQKTIAMWLAMGVPEDAVAEKVGVSVTFIKTLLKGGLFDFEVKEARKQLIGERLDEYTKLVSEQLRPNLETMVAIRDDATAKTSDRLRAAELINAALVPKATPRDTTETKVRINITADKQAHIQNAIHEAETVDVTRDSPEEG